MKNIKYLLIKVVVLGCLIPSSAQFVFANEPSIKAKEEDVKPLNSAKKNIDTKAVVDVAKPDLSDVDDSGIVEKQNLPSNTFESVTMPMFRGDVDRALLESISTLCDMKGKYLGINKLSTGTNIALKLALKSVPPVRFFLETINKRQLLNEAVFRTSIAYSGAKNVDGVIQLLQDLLDNSATIDVNVALPKLLMTEPFKDVKAGMRLVVEALQAFAVDKNYLKDKRTGKLNMQGEVFVKTVSAIIGNSLRARGLEEKSKVLALLQALSEGFQATAECLGKIDKGWQEPKYAMRWLLEIQAFVSDILCGDAQGYKITRNFADNRSNREFFIEETNACRRKG